MRRYKAMSERSHSLQRVQTSGLSSLFAHTRQTRQAAALTRVRRRPVSQDSQHLAVIGWQRILLVLETALCPAPPSTQAMHSPACRL